MSGYTPLFQSLTTGTLCGRWPDIGLWPIVLSLADRNGVVDVTPQYLAGVTGLAVEEVRGCMERFCEPDPYSRSTEAGGARLQLIDPAARNWGWNVVNHGKYREKARLASKNEREVASGSNQERLKHRREPMTAGDRRRPPVTDPSDKTRQDKTKTQSAREGFDGWEFVEKRMQPNYPKGEYPPTVWINVARTIERVHLEHGKSLDDIEAGAKRYLAKCTAEGIVGSRFVVNPDRFVLEERYTLPFTITTQPVKPAEDPEAVQAWSRLLASEGADRPPEVHRALEAIGGWSRIRERTAKETPFLRKEFIQAFTTARAAA